MRKEERQRAYRINCRPAYSAGWQGINFELKCNVMGRVGTGRGRVRVRGNQEAVRGRIGTQGRAFPSMTQNRVMCAQGSGRGVEPLCQGDSASESHIRPISWLTARGTKPPFCVNCVNNHTCSAWPTYHYCRRRWF